jgi:hypothetical protein
MINAVSLPGFTSSEIDGDVSRQDLDFRVAIAAKKAGWVFALDSDAHAADHLWMADYAIARTPCWDTQGSYRQLLADR